MKTLFSDLKTDEEKSKFFLSGRGYESGVIAPSIQNDVAMAYHRCAELKKELAALQSQDAEDAARYRWLCDGNGYFMEENQLCGHGNDKAKADAAIDRARRNEGE